MIYACIFLKQMGDTKVSEGLWNGLKSYVESFAYVRNVKSGHDRGMQNKWER